MQGTLVRAAVAGTLLTLSTLSFADQYPSKLVRFVIPYPAGGPTDTVGRLLAQKLSEQTGQTFLIDNAPGGNGAIGADKVAKSKPDGYTLLFNPSAFTTSPMVSKVLSYNVERDFTPVALVAKGPIAVFINKELPVQDIAGLIAHAKAVPDKLAFAIGSIASAGHLSTELLQQQGGIKFLIVPYKGSSPAYQDLLGGQIQGFMDPLLGGLSHYKANRVKMLAVTSKERVPSLTNVPTVAETLPGFEFYSWYGVWGPPKLPQAIVAKINEEVNKAITSGPLRERLLQEGYFLAPGTPEEFARFQHDDMQLSAKIIADANIQPE
jgi:tripartite-type tricarboxylate transporter receptor subunit TctC